MNQEGAKNFRETGLLVTQFDTISVLDLLSVKEPLVLHIPTYQRGYRWRKQQVETLIADLDEFSCHQQESPGQSYPLQPIVIRQVYDGSSPKPFHFEIVDGQQRLTTIHLMLDTWRSVWSECHSEWKLWTLYYDETEKDSLWSLTAACKENTRIVSQQHAEHAERIIDLIYQERVYFLYYLVGGSEIRHESPHEVFLRLNDGKIALTDSELIRALFWNRTVTKDESYSPNQIAAEWEQLESLCWDPGFWSMICRKNYKSFSRIDRLFEIFLKTSKKAEKDPLSKVTFDAFSRAVRQNDGKGLVDGEKLQKKWQELIQLVWKLKSWYFDIELYHYICWLCRYAKKTIEDLLEENKDSQNETDFKCSLQKSIYCEKDGEGLALRHLVSEPIDKDGNVYSEERLKEYYREYSGIPYAYPGESELESEMPYGDEIKLALIRDRKRIEALLVLFNIESLNENYRKSLKLLRRQDVSISSDRWERFPFELFDSERVNTTWNIEHISPQTKNAMDGCEEQIVWALETLEESELDSEICKGSNIAKIKHWLAQQYRKRHSEFKDVLVKYHLDYNYEMTDVFVSEISFDEIYRVNAQTDIDVKWHDRIGNLTLLDKKTNILNQNSIFPKKRRIVREVLMGRDCVGERQEHRFVPSCTAKVFMKYYTTLSASNSRWCETDVMDYELEMRHIFSMVMNRMFSEGAK